MGWKTFSHQDAGARAAAVHETLPPGAAMGKGRLPSVCAAHGAEVSLKGTTTESHRELRKWRRLAPPVSLRWGFVSRSVLKEASEGGWQPVGA